MAENTRRRARKRARTEKVRARLFMLWLPIQSPG